MFLIRNKGLDLSVGNDTAVTNEMCPGRVNPRCGHGEAGSSLPDLAEGSWSTYLPLLILARLSQELE